MSDKEKPSILDGVPAEMTVAEASVYLKRGFDVLAEVAEDKTKDTDTRFKATVGLQAYYLTVATPEFLDTQFNKANRTNNRAIDEVKRLRGKDKDADWKGETESED